jgi:hypothetical protein
MNVQEFNDKFNQVTEKLNSNTELSQEELHILLVAHLMEEERNELNPK